MLVINDIITAIIVCWSTSSDIVWHYLNVLWIWLVVNCLYKCNLAANICLLLRYYNLAYVYTQNLVCDLSNNGVCMTPTEYRSCLWFLATYQALLLCVQIILNSFLRLTCFSYVFSSDLFRVGLSLRYVSNNFNNALICVAAVKALGYNGRYNNVVYAAFVVFSFFMLCHRTVHQYCSLFWVSVWVTIPFTIS